MTCAPSTHGHTGPQRGREADAHAVASGAPRGASRTHSRRGLRLTQRRVVPEAGTAHPRDQLVPGGHAPGLPSVRRFRVHLAGVGTGTFRRAFPLYITTVLFLLEYNPASCPQKAGEEKQEWNRHPCGDARGHGARQGAYRGRERHSRSVAPAAKPALRCIHLDLSPRTKHVRFHPPWVHLLHPC